MNRGTSTELLRNRYHGLLAQATELRATPREEAHDAATSLEREAEEISRVLYRLGAQAAVERARKAGYRVEALST